MSNTRISFVYFCTCHAAWSKLTKASLQVFSLLCLQAGVKQKLVPMCVPHHHYQSALEGASTSLLPMHGNVNLNISTDRKWLNVLLTFLKLLSPKLMIMKLKKVIIFNNKGKTLLYFDPYLILLIHVLNNNKLLKSEQN